MKPLAVSAVLYCTNSAPTRHIYEPAQRRLHLSDASDERTRPEVRVGVPYTYQIGKNKQQLLAHCSRDHRGWRQKGHSQYSMLTMTRNWERSWNCILSERTAASIVLSRQRRTPKRAIADSVVGDERRLYRQRFDMPEMNGIDFLEAIRETHRSCRC